MPLALNDICSFRTTVRFAFFSDLRPHGSVFGRHHSVAPGNPESQLPVFSGSGELIRRVSTPPAWGQEHKFPPHTNAGDMDAAAIVIDTNFIGENIVATRYVLR
jgi:hypothetical protein